MLPFGLRSAPFIFNCLAEAIEWLARQRGIAPIHHYLDDFFIAGPQCSQHLDTLTSLCELLNIPLTEDKREGPTTQLEYLGILLDSSSLEARLPPDKLQELKVTLPLWKERASFSKQELLSLIGTLSFAAKVVPAGRTFLRRAIDLSTSASQPHETISLDRGFRLDILWWLTFASPWSGKSFFLLPNRTPSPDLELFTDSSGCTGFGAYLQGEWFNGGWSAEQANLSIQYKELYPIVLSACVWSRLKVRFNCDNLAIVSCIKTGCPLHLLRNLIYMSAIHNFSTSAQHIPGTHNIIADSLSRFQMQKFYHHAPQAALHPTPIPHSLPLHPSTISLPFYPGYLRIRLTLFHAVLPYIQLYQCKWPHTSRLGIHPHALVHTSHIP